MKLLIIWIDMKSNVLFSNIRILYNESFCVFAYIVAARQHSMHQNNAERQTEQSCFSLTLSAPICKQQQAENRSCRSPRSLLLVLVGCAKLVYISGESVHDDVQQKSFVVLLLFLQSLFIPIKESQIAVRHKHSSPYVNIVGWLFTPFCYV